MSISTPPLAMAKPSSSPPAKLLFSSLLSLSFLSLILLFLSKTTPPCPPNCSPATGLHNPFPPPPRIAYYISGSGGDGPRVFRLLSAVYHPRNRYLLHLDRRASQAEREEVAESVEAVDAFRAAGNVDVVGKADFVNSDGSSAVAAVLRGAAILMRRWKDWDWFVNLAASDYPLISQDDFLHVLSFLPRDFNFIKHTSDIGWKEYQRMLPIIVDPGLYRASKSEIFYGSSKRPLPNAYKVFTGSPSVVLSWKFIEFAVLGWDNLPRTLLLYFSNVRYSRRGYFHTLACNSREFHDTVVNSDLKFAVWDNPPGKQSRHLRMSDFDKMIASGMPFAETILSNDSVLDKIDASVLHRSQSRLAPGG
eukprot:TRINITY_DN8188_c0_g2_i2.p1 TRINITY_DN8188_c0_g2~~TRINITY_DN8188_c0_g2_i2.p1  ORF type:complete len:363 (-),score=54.53 TRINITY_DN8188_c0_g2_i2:883-1971(-)